MDAPTQLAEGHEDPGSRKVPLDSRESLRWFALGWLLQRSAKRRFSFRLLESVAVSLALSQLLLAALADWAVDAAPLTTRFMTTTLSWVLWFALVSGWFLCAGFLDGYTRRLLEDVARQRAGSLATLHTLELEAQTLWLVKVTLLPLLAVGLPLVVQARNLRALLHLGTVLSLCVLASGLAAVAIALAAQGIRRLSPEHPRRLAAVVLLGPELLRLIDPTLPTLRTIAGSVSAWVQFWSRGA